MGPIGLKIKMLADCDPFWSLRKTLTSCFVQLLETACFHGPFLHLQSLQHSILNSLSASIFKLPSLPLKLLPLF